MHVAVDERFVDHPEPGDEDAYPIENDFVDLAPMVHDAILLELPLAPLCREECRGLCPVLRNRPQRGELRLCGAGGPALGYTGRT